MSDPNPHSASDSDAARDIVSTRVIGAPRGAVFRAFTDPDVLARWWGPREFTNDFHLFEPRPGGAWRFTMRGPDGAAYEMKKAFVDVAPPERIVVDHLEPAVHRFRMTMTFDEDGPGRTRLHWHMRFDDAEEAGRVRAVIVAANEENFDRLEEALGGAR